MVISLNPIHGFGSLRAAAKSSACAIRYAPLPPLVVKMARTTAMGNKRRPFLIGTARTGWQTMKEDEAIRAALREMHRRGVNIDRAPKEALDLVIDANTPMENDHPALRPRGR